MNMKRLLTIVLCLTVFSWITSAKQVEEKIAIKVAGNFFASRIGMNPLKALPIPVLVCTSKDLKTNQDAGTNAFPAFYVYNFTTSPGFVIVSGDDIVTPILGYSTEGSFSMTNLAPAVASFLWSYEEQIKSAVAQKIPATPEIESAWIEYQTTASGSNHSDKGVKTVEPLIKLYWNQSPYYNKLCPENINPKELTVTGCVATAMAMVMKYHNYPKQGTGSASNKTAKYGTLSANFGGTKYAWNVMPDRLGSTSDTAAINAVATLMYHCGIAVEMEYGIAAVGGSAAYVIDFGTKRRCTENALKNYFGYDPALRGLSRNSYTDMEWIDLLKEDLDARLPVLYAAQDPRPKGGGHAFICDGYDDNGKFHINWGWGGEDNGYFEINSLNPSSYKYICGHEMIKGARPMPGQGKYFNLNLSAPLTLFSDIIQYEDSISISTSIRNNGKSDFTGSLGAAIFDSNQLCVGFIETLNPFTIWAGENAENITFKNSGLPEMLPGKYMIGIMYSYVGDDWMEVNDTLQYVNFPVVEVINSDVIEMASVMTVLPNILTEGKAATVKLAIRNNGSADYSGILNLAIHDADGNFLYSIAEKGNFTLPAGSASGELTFSTNRIPVSAGSYMIALWYKNPGNAEFELVGSSGFQNPVKVLVNASPLMADRYEPNDSVQISSVLSLSFSGNRAKILLDNANCHVGTDVDFYKIILPIGFSYNIEANLRNSEYDTSWSHPLNGFWNYLRPQDTVWQFPCNNSGPSKFESAKGGDLFFYVYTNFIKQTGMYQLEINISKNPLGVNESDQASSLVVYPNPSSGIIYLINKEATPGRSEIIVRNIMGTEIYNKKDVAVGTDPYSINLSEFPSGIYFVTIKENSKLQRNIKISIAR